MWQRRQVCGNEARMMGQAELWGCVELVERGPELAPEPELGHVPDVFAKTAAWPGSLHEVAVRSVPCRGNRDSCRTLQTTS